MKGISDLVRVIEYYFILENAVKIGSDEKKSKEQDDGYISIEFLEYIRQNPNSKIGF
jgi:hypothetical protein